MPHFKRRTGWLIMLAAASALVGLIFLFGVYPLMMFLWSNGWRCQPNQPEYEQMILGVYATLGIFLLLAARNPSENRSLIAFTAWSSLVHAAIMAVQAFQHPRPRIPPLRSVVADRDDKSLLLPDQHEQPLAPRDPRADQVALEQHGEPVCQRGGDNCAYCARWNT